MSKGNPLEYGDRSAWLPYPELLDDEHESYRIFDSDLLGGLPSSGMVDKVGRRMWVPLTPEGRVISRHELGHIMWSPRVMPRVRFSLEVFLAVEDARVNTGLRLCNVPIELSPEQCERVVQLGRSDLEQGMVAIYLLRTVASIGTNVEDGLLDLLPEGIVGLDSLQLRKLFHQTRDALERARISADDVVAPARKVIRIARDLARALKRLGYPIPDRSGGICVICAIEGPSCGEGDTRVDPIWGESAEEIGAEIDGSPPGTLEIVEAPLDLRCDPTVTTRQLRWVASDEGTDFCNVQRLVTDARIFRRLRPRRQAGGSVLIDVSGSMSLSASDVDRIIEKAPGAMLVAIYSGSDDQGELRIVVRNGRRARPEHLEPYGGGNIVDLPALAWLAEQPGPRIWLSDGRVTGCGDSGSQDMRRHCRALCRRAGIVRVPDTAGAVKALAAGPTAGRSRIPASARLRLAARTAREATARV